MSGRVAADCTPRTVPTPVSTASSRRCSCGGRLLGANGHQADPPAFPIHAYRAHAYVRAGRISGSHYYRLNDPRFDWSERHKDEISPLSQMSRTASPSTLQTRVAASGGGVQVERSGVLQPWNPRRHVRVSRFTALRPPQFPPPRLTAAAAAAEVTPSPALTSEAAPASPADRQRSASAENVRLFGQKRGDVPTSSWVRPTVFHHRRRGVRDYGVQPACVYGGVFA